MQSAFIERRAHFSNTLPMANAGRSSDSLLVKRLIKEGKYIKHYPGERWCVWDMKNRINKLILDDVVHNERYNGKNYEVHSAWRHTTRLMIKLNQIRLHEWYFDKLKE